ncbi:Rv1733c family protein [Streptomyces sp. NPDC002306]
MSGENGVRRHRLWRWRKSPLRRREDIVEAWVVLFVWVAVVVGGVLAGLVTAWAADDAFARQRAERYSVEAVLLTDVAPPVAGAEGTHERVATKVRFTAADGSVRTDRALVDPGLKAGTTVEVWLNARDELSVEPPSMAAASFEAAVIGTGAGLALASLVLGAGAVAKWRLDRRRIDEWGREWDLVGPRWGHKTG